MRFFSAEYHRRQGRFDHTTQRGRICNAKTIAIYEGKNYCVVKEPIHSRLVKELREQGYRVERGPWVYVLGDKDVKLERHTYIFW